MAGFELSINGGFCAVHRGMPRVISVSTQRFVCLLAWDARAARVEEISETARQLLDAGAVYVCVWGPGGERVHDIIDEESVGPNPEESRVVTTPESRWGHTLY